jgi:2-C-methyl-D-erythritol 2,4-cyclodiphosphate synthase
MYRIGHGFDVHAFAKDRKLILGGVEIKHPMGLKGHSDADVVIHAIMDAILGAMAQGDIGQHFPDSDKQYKNIDSRILLRKIAYMMESMEYKLCNVDITIHAEAPKLAGYIGEMRVKLAEDLGCDRYRISVKATTWEKLGFIGRKEGIAADAVVLLDDNEDDSNSDYDDEWELDDENFKDEDGGEREDIKDEKDDKAEFEDHETTSRSRQIEQLFDESEKTERRVKMKGEIVIYADGASRGNPGPAGAGAVIMDSEGKVIQEISMFLGEMTNNQAEYRALILALGEVTAMRPESVTIYLDSELIVNQINGKYKVKNEGMISLNALVMQQLMTLSDWTITHVPREKNSKADALANKAIDAKL